MKILISQKRSQKTQQIKRIVIVCFGFMTLCISCNQSSQKKEDTTAVAPTTTGTIQPEDSLTVQLRSAITSIEKQELEQASKIQWMYIDNIQHSMTSLKDFYAIRKTELEKGMKYSANKEKTQKALDYLDQVIATSSGDPVVYKVTFHMKALLANTTKYDERHVKFLKQDLSEINIVFP